MQVIVITVVSDLKGLTAILVRKELLRNSWKTCSGDFLSVGIVQAMDIDGDYGMY